VMRLSKKDAIAGAAFAAVIVPYVGYVVRGSMPFIQDPRGMASVGLAGLAVILAAWGAGSAFEKVMMTSGVAAFGLGLAAAFVGTEGSEVLLAAFMSVLGAIWAIETLGHVEWSGFHLPGKHT